jgi:hypothetical protein
MMEEVELDTVDRYPDSMVGQELMWAALKTLGYPLTKTPFEELGATDSWWYSPAKNGRSWRSLDLTKSQLFDLITSHSIGIRQSAAMLKSNDYIAERRMSGGKTITAFGNTVGEAMLRCLVKSELASDESTFAVPRDVVV